MYLLYSSHLQEGRAKKSEKYQKKQIKTFKKLHFYGQSRDIGGTMGTVISVYKFLFQILFASHTPLLYIHRSVVLKKIFN